MVSDRRKRALILSHMGFALSEDGGEPGSDFVPVVG
jgi:hypothetical protein